MVLYNNIINNDVNTTLTSTPSEALGTMDILRVNEDDFNFVANSLNLMPSFLSSDLTLAVRLLTVCCLLMALSLLGSSSKKGWGSSHERGGDGGAGLL